MPYTDRSPWKNWMPVFNDEFDSVALARRQAEASAAGKERYAKLLAMREEDEAVLSQPSMALILDEAVSLSSEAMWGLAAKLLPAGTSAAVDVEEASQALARALAALAGYGTLRERPLNEYEQGLFIVSDDGDRTVYMKTEKGDFYDLEGNEIVSGLARPPLVKPLRLNP